MTYDIPHLLLHGTLAPSPAFLALFTLASALLTLLAVSCYLHRSQTHRAIRFIAPLNHVFRLILWFTTGMVTKEWVAIHRKHHAMCDTSEDPHSPRYFGVRKILLEGADIYRKAGTEHPEILVEYGEGTPDDWLERHVYAGALRNWGIRLTLIVELILFGLPALIIWPIQMLVIPIIAAGFINGIAHVWGYQRYKDGMPRGDGKVYERIGDARNVPTYGLAVGEEFHNNHHAEQWNYKFSHAWYEFDLAGTFAELLTWIGFAWVPRRRN
ncbi:MAG TPA: fatty acid desaturase [Candidatus Paceibacterota bacterium]|nr:fatty acid desaturase [Candidatus Paceibacterota bacterium]